MGIDTTVGFILNTGTGALIDGNTEVKFLYSGTLVNTGLIEDISQGAIFGRPYYFADPGLLAPTTVVNSWTIEATGSAGVGVTLPPGSFVTNAAGALIQGNIGVDMTRVTYSSRVPGYFGTFTNAGTIAGTESGILGSHAILINEAGAIITGGSSAVYGGFGLENAGTIDALGSAGIGLVTGDASTADNDASGVIEGSTGVLINRGSEVDNFGTIASTLGPYGVAVQFPDISGILIVEPGSDLVGRVQGCGSVDVREGGVSYCSASTVRPASKRLKMPAPVPSSPTRHRSSK